MSKICCLLIREFRVAGSHSRIIFLFRSKKTICNVKRRLIRKKETNISSFLKIGVLSYFSNFDTRSEDFMKKFTSRHFLRPRILVKLATCKLSLSTFCLTSQGRQHVNKLSLQVASLTRIRGRRKCLFTRQTNQKWMLGSFHET